VAPLLPSRTQTHRLFVQQQFSLKLAASPATVFLVPAHERLSPRARFLLSRATLPDALSRNTLCVVTASLRRPTGGGVGDFQSEASAKLLLRQQMPIGPLGFLDLASFFSCQIRILNMPSTVVLCTAERALAWPTTFSESTPLRRRLGGFNYRNALRKHPPTRRLVNKRCLFYYSCTY